jgi:cephalosporin-C deacetylase
MALFDLPLSDLHTYRPEVHEPADLDAFWSARIADARATDPLIDMTRVQDPFTLVDTWDVTFAGYAGDPIRAWYMRPAGVESDLPVVVEFIGYGGGRGLPSEHLAWPCAGYAHLVMDTRGQGSGWGAGGDTPDPEGSGAATDGVMTRGIADPSTYYYTRLFVDAVRAIDTARVLPGADGTVASTGASQGGGLALAAGSLVPDVDAVIANVPFLSHIDRAIDVTDSDPYHQIVNYLAVHRDQEQAVRRTLSYIDVMHLARRAQAPALFSTALRDMTCPPSTVFAARNHYGELARGAGADDGAAGSAQTDGGAAATSTGQEPPRIEVYPFNTHEGGDAAHRDLQIAWLGEQLGR